VKCRERSKMGRSGTSDGGLGIFRRGGVGGKKYLGGGVQNNEEAPCRWGKTTFRTLPPPLPLKVERSGGPKKDEDRRSGTRWMSPMRLA
jgi:hypothetical protein